MRPEGEHVQGLADRGYEDELPESVTRRPRAVVTVTSWLLRRPQVSGWGWDT